LLALAAGLSIYGRLAGPGDWSEMTSSLHSPLLWAASYVVGGIPALLTGAATSGLPGGAVSRTLLSGVVGALLSGLILGFFTWPLVLITALIGGAAAMICAAVLELLAATPTRVRRDRPN
jgi:hypothetical protein